MRTGTLRRRDVLCGLGALALSSTGKAAEPQLLRAADVHVNGYPTVEAVRWISSQLEKQTGGRLRIHVYYAGQLGREPDTVDLARFGALDITRVNFAALTNPFPLTRAFVLPYVFESVAHMRRAVDGAPGKAVLKSFEQRGLVGLAIYDAGSRSFYNVRRPIVEPADLGGLRVRVPPSDVFLDMGHALGANPTPLPVNDVYSALQTHLIDGAENNWNTFHTSRHFEVARYVSTTEHSYSPEALLMSKHTFDALSPSDKDLVLATASESVSYMRQLWDAAEANSKAEVLRAGVLVNRTNREAFRRATAPFVETQLRTSSGVLELYRAIRAEG